jgi:hypothetical protein
MKRSILFLLLLCLVLPLAAGVLAGAGTCNGQPDTDGIKTMGGSCKDDAGQIQCGTTGKRADVGTIAVLVNQGADQTEVEGCNMQGAGNQQGRFIVRANHNTANPGATTNGVRVSLDSDKDQTPANICCGYINAQVSQEHPGVWCGPHGGAAGDGYARPWNNPGSNGGPSDPTYCIPGQ